MSECTLSLNMLTFIIYLVPSWLRIHQCKDRWVSHSLLLTVIALFDLLFKWDGIFFIIFHRNGVLQWLATWSEYVAIA